MATEKQTAYIHSLIDQWIEKLNAGNTLLYHEIFRAYIDAHYPDLDSDDIEKCEQVEAEVLQFTKSFLQSLKDKAEKWTNSNASAWIDALRGAGWADYLRKKIG